MTYHVVPFTNAQIPAALELFAAAYQQEQRTSPLLPPMGEALRGRIAQALSDGLRYPGVAICDGAQLLGYLCLCGRFEFKGQQAGIVREYAHGAVDQDKALIYQLLYAALAEDLVFQGIHLHAFCHLAGDGLLKETLFQLGFGALVAEELRDLAPVPGSSEARIMQEADWSMIAGLASEHMGYYPRSPIFLLRDDSPAEVRKELAEHERAGDVLLVAYQDGGPCAYYIVGRCLGEEEGFLLAGTNTAQILSAYAQPSARGRGIGKALLQAAVDWARAAGYERLMVEHETANLYGGNFWRRHFAPYCYASIRYVDCRL